MSVATDWYGDKAVAAVDFAAKINPGTDAALQAIVGAIKARADIEPSSADRRAFIDKILGWARQAKEGYPNLYLAAARFTVGNDEERKAVFDAAMRPETDGFWRDYSIAAALASTDQERQLVRDAATAQLRRNRSGDAASQVRQAIATRRTLGGLGLVTEDEEARRDVARLAAWYAGKMPDQEYANISSQRSVELALRPRATPAVAPAPAGQP
jgi:hypothetical protein